MEGHRNRLCKDYDSEMSPRRRPPPIHGAQMVKYFENTFLRISLLLGSVFSQVARFQPLVPEVSLYFGPSTAISQAEPLQEVPRPQPQPAKRQPLAPINSNRGGAAGGQRPPSPSKCNQLDATANFSFSSDTQVMFCSVFFTQVDSVVAPNTGRGLDDQISSQIFERLEKLMTRKEELATPRPPSLTEQSPNASKEVLDLLEWQNGQIRDLQAKLGQLMASGRRESAVTDPDDRILGRLHSQSDASLPQRLTSPEGLQPSARYTCQCNTCYVKSAI